jgi:hypothetical protein
LNGPRKLRQERDWYKVSVETLRGWGIFVLLVAVAGAGYLGYRLWERYAIQREAAQVIDEARVLFQRVRGEGSLGNFKAETDTAWEGIEQARALYAEKKWGDALQRAQRSRDVLLSLLDASQGSGDGGEAQFIAVQGRVEYRRSDRGEWEQARSRVTLSPGDYVKTGNGGSAEIMFTDGTLYTVRPDTLFLVSARSDGDESEQSIELQHGWVNLNTAQGSSKVATPQAEAVISNESEAVIAYDGESQQARFANYRGEVQVSSSSGETRTLAPLQAVAQTQGTLSDVQKLPAAPLLLSPEDNADFDIASNKQLELGWEEVAGGERYALQVSRNRLFVDNVIDVQDRRTTLATLGIQGEGSFVWRVAAVAEGGLRGPWSAVGRFRVASFETGRIAQDEEPPALEVHDVQSYGSIFIVSGRTEPGSSVQVNGEPVAVGADGTFTKTVQLGQSGWAFLDVVAADPAGNRAQSRSRVFVESL